MDLSEEGGSAQWRERPPAVAPAGRTEDLVTLVRIHHQDLGRLNAALQQLVHREGGLQGLLELLQDDDAEVRAYAAQALGSTGCRAASQALRRALQDPAPNVCSLAIESLANLGAREAVPELLKLAQSDDFFLAFPAIEALGQLGDSQAVPVLLARIGEEVVGEAVVVSLGRIGDRRGVRPILDWMAHGGPPDVALCSLARLGELDEPLRQQVLEHLTEDQAATALRSMFGGFFADGAVTAAYWLATSPWPGVQQESQRLLVHLLNQPDARDLASRALLALGSDAVPALLNGLETAPDAAHQAIIMLLGRLDDDRALPVLRELLASDDTAVVALGVEAWARLWPRHQDLQPLLEVLGHPSPVVRQVAATAIGGLLDDSVAEQLHARLEGATVLERESITRILGQASGEHAALLTALHDPETSVRRIAIAMLARRVGSNGAAAAAVGDVLQSGPPSVRAAAAHALALAPDSFARPLLLEALRDEDGWTRMQVCKSLARLGHDDDAERIAALQHDPGPYVRAAVAEALGILHGAVVVPTLIDLVRDPVADVQAAARAALATHGSPEARRVLESLDGTTSSP